MTAENLAIDINDPLKPYHKLKGSNVLGEPLHLVWSAAIICTVFPLLLVTEGKVQEPDNTDIVWNFSRAGGMKTAIAKKHVRRHDTSSVAATTSPALKTNVAPNDRC
ncbi:hypothetical protein MHU86_22386 [Fragilaria crotonensis]|nr:hypothetical protein MHU86_22386 [Fragilaria crotonensis]